MTSYPGDESVSSAVLSGDYAELASRLLKLHADSGGRGIDPYSKVVVVHPMAEAKYLAAMAVLVNANLLNVIPVKEVEQAIVRLEVSAISFQNGRLLAWGLNFGWKSHDARQVFVITTALVVRGLWQVFKAIPEVRSRAVDLIARGLSWLTSDQVSVQVGERRLPVYGPGDQSVVNNVVAQWSLALWEAGGSSSNNMHLAVRGAQYVDRNHIQGVGWTYSARNNVVDLVHTAYITEALLPMRSHLSADLDIRASEALLVFGDRYDWADTCRLVPARDALGKGPATSSTRTRIVGTRALVGLQVPARDWSIGALLSVACDLTKLEVGVFWMEQAKGISQRALTTFAEVRYPRHAMHGAEGLAKFAALTHS